MARDDSPFRQILCGGAEKAGRVTNKYKPIWVLAAASKGVYVRRRKIKPEDYIPVISQC